MSMGKPQNAVGIRLHAFQREMVSQARNVIREGQRRVLIVSETGSGKTVMGMELASHLRGRGLWLAHRTFLRDQAEETRRRMGLEGLALDVRMVRDGSVDIGAYDWIVVDEAHHTAAESWRGAMESGKVVVGLTATPHRMDGVSMREAGWEAMVKGPRLSWLFQEGFLERPEIWYNLAAASSPSGVELAPECLARLIGERHRKRTLVFAESLDAAREGAAAVERATGLKTAIISHKDGADGKEETLEAFGSGEVAVIFNYQVLTEGYDLPELDTVVINRATESRTLYFQMRGRVLRPGSIPPVIYDVGGAALKTRVNLLDDAEWSLDEGVIQRSRDVDGMAADFVRQRRKDPGPKVGEGSGYVMGTWDELMVERAWAVVRGDFRRSSEGVEGIVLSAWPTVGEYSGEAQFLEAIKMSPNPFRKVVKRLGLEWPSHWRKKRLNVVDEIRDRWDECCKEPTRSAAARMMAVDVSSISRAAVVYGLEEPPGWKNENLKGRSHFRGKKNGIGWRAIILKELHMAGEFERLSMFSKWLGADPRTVSKIMAEAGFEIPESWKETREKAWKKKTR